MKTVKTEYVRLTVKSSFQYTITEMDGSYMHMDHVAPGDTFEGYVDPSQITSRGKTISILEMELSEELGHISQVSIVPRSKVSLERLDCSMSIKGLMSAIA